MAQIRHLLLVILLPVLAGCDKESGLFGVSPARKLEGTWTTPFAPTLYYYSDFCGSYIRVAKTTIGMRWEITKTGSNTVDIEVYKISSTPVQYLVSSGCAFFIPMVTPLGLRGEISASQLTIINPDDTIAGSFSFTTDNLTGDFNSYLDFFCGLYCSGVGSDSKAITLTR